MSESSKPTTHSNPLTDHLFAALKRNPKRIVFTEGEDERVVRVAAQLVALEVAVPILLGNRARIQAIAVNLNVSLMFVKVLDPRDSSDLDLFCKRLEKMERYRGRVAAETRDVMVKPHNFAAMMLQYGQADAMVSGNQANPAIIYRALMQFIKKSPHTPRLFSVVAMASEELQHFGSEGMLFLADCGVNPEPSVEDLAGFAVETGKLAEHFMGHTPKVAMLSHSTHGTMPTTSSKRVAAATVLARDLAKRQRVNIEIDGELQADVALDMAAAEVKLKDARAAKSADVLVFPNLDSAHIAFKLLEHVGGAKMYGHLLCGLSRPAAQVPKTVTEESLLGTAALVGVEAIKYRDLYPDGEIV
ncbi:phosphate acyltransferase [Rubritalea marina]|uniref:phosphate acyltransferase n=1 Tax=Rubritalea marina TaxID=361055 RepID=UPI0003619B3B|nr:phosphate acyltransferase [Rubritalea marina]